MYIYIYISFSIIIYQILLFKLPFGTFVKALSNKFNLFNSLRTPIKEPLKSVGIPASHLALEMHFQSLSLLHSLGKRFSICTHYNKHDRGRNVKKEEERGLCVVRSSLISAHSTYLMPQSCCSRLCVYIYVLQLFDSYTHARTHKRFPDRPLPVRLSIYPWAVTAVSKMEGEGKELGA